MTFDIQAAAVDDLPTIYSFELAYIQEIEPEMESAWKNAVHLHLRQWIDNFPRLLVAVQTGQARQLVGHGFWQAEGDDAVLASLYVAPEARRRGVGNQLLRRFEEDARAQGFTHLTLGVRLGNPAAALYCQAGYQWTGKDGYYDDYEKILASMARGESGEAGAVHDVPNKAVLL